MNPVGGPAPNCWLCCVGGGLAPKVHAAVAAAVDLASQPEAARHQRSPGPWRTLAIAVGLRRSSPTHISTSPHEGAGYIITAVGAFFARVSPRNASLSARVERHSPTVYTKIQSLPVTTPGTQNTTCPRTKCTALPETLSFSLHTRQSPCTHSVTVLRSSSLPTLPVALVSRPSGSPSPPAFFTFRRPAPSDSSVFRRRRPYYLLIQRHTERQDNIEWTNVRVHPSYEIISFFCFRISARDSSVRTLRRLD